MKLFPLVLIIALLVLGCTGPGIEVDPESRVAAPTPAPTPTPTPKPLRVLFLTDHVDGFAYMDYVERLAAAHKAIVHHSPYDAQISFADYQALLLVRMDEQTKLTAAEQAARAGIPAAVLDLASGEAAQEMEGVAYASYQAGDAAGFALDVAIAYPPHDTPVRMLALLEVEGSPGDEAYQKRIDEGKLFDRGVFYSAGEGADARAFLNERLDRYVEGLTDAIIIEGGALFEAALDVLDKRGRTDMEVFLIPEGGLREQQVYYKPYVFPLAMGADIEGELERLFEALLRIRGADAPTHRTFTPRAVTMDTAKAAQVLE